LKKEMMRNKNRLLITGVSGMLGNNLAYYFKDKHDILGLYNSHPVSIDGISTEKCDLFEPGNIKTIIKNYNPHIIAHCASLTNIDECEADKVLTTKINVEATKNIVETVLDKDIKIIYISSDSVYDGQKGYFSEDDEVNPQNHYGLSKYRGELEVSKHPQSLTLRTNLFGWNVRDKNSLGEWILNNLKEEKKINGFKDVYFSSIYTMEIARIVDIALKKELTGTYNCGAVDSCSKYEFAIKIADFFNYEESLISPISIAESELKTKRGNNLSLNVNKLQRVLDYRLPTIDHSVEAFYRDYKCGLSEKIRYTSGC
jgi:dTDP-4-dehydrorhamnose reductase